MKTPSPQAKRASKNVDRNRLRDEFYKRVDSERVPIREAVRQFRLMLGMTQREFAAFTKVSPRVVMAFEQGVGNPTIKTVAKLLRGSGLELYVGRGRR